MKNNSNQWKRFYSTSTFSGQVFSVGQQNVKLLSGVPLLSSMPFLPGVGLILLGLVIFVAPKFFLAAVATFIILVGAIVCYVAWRLTRLKRHVSKLAEQFQHNFEARPFRAQNSDEIDITEFINKKTYLH